jgi:hypothetical protein
MVGMGNSYEDTSWQMAATTGIATTIVPNIIYTPFVTPEERMTIFDIWVIDAKNDEILARAEVIAANADTAKMLADVDLTPETKKQMVSGEIVVLAAERVSYKPYKKRFRNGD